jgi:hypothetical protein
MNEGNTKDYKIINPTIYRKDCKIRNVILFIICLIFIFTYLLVIINSNDNFQNSIRIIVIISLIITPILTYSDKVGYFILYDDRIKLHNSSIRSIIHRIKKEYYFEDISNISKKGKFYKSIRIEISLNSDKKIMQYVDSIDDLNLILNTYNGYKKSSK